MTHSVLVGTIDYSLTFLLHLLIALETISLFYGKVQQYANLNMHNDNNHESFVDLFGYKAGVYKLHCTIIIYIQIF